MDNLSQKSKTFLQYPNFNSASIYSYENISAYDTQIVSRLRWVIQSLYKICSNLIYLLYLDLIRRLILSSVHAALHGIC